jgi:hypothetical protein
MHRVYGNKRKRSEETREIADNSGNVVELEVSYVLERLGTLYGRSEDIFRVYMVRNKVNPVQSLQPASSQEEV